MNITINDSTVNVYNINTDTTTEMSLRDIIEKYYKNTEVNINNVEVNKINLTEMEKYMIDILNNKDNNNNENECRVFEAQILIPYRDYNLNSFRKEQLHRFLQHMNEYFKIVHPNLRYKLVIIEQNNYYMFNRGILLNIGFLECEKAKNEKINYYVHHNCDLFPKIEYNPPLDYSFTPVNMVRDIFGYITGIGGIAIFNRLTFEMINGFPNDYFNWGAEDTTLYNRCINNNFIIDRPFYNKGVSEETHSKDSSCNNINIKKGEQDDPASNGLTTCNYTSIINENTEFNYENVIHYLVDFDYIN